MKQQFALICCPSYPAFSYLFVFPESMHDQLLSMHVLWSWQQPAGLAEDLNNVMYPILYMMHLYLEQKLQAMHASICNKSP
jgi:hypothetical protein